MKGGYQSPYIYSTQQTILETNREANTPLLTHNQHDPGKVRALEGKDGTNLKEIGAKTNKNNKNGQIDTGDLVIDDDEAEDKNEDEDQKTTKEEMEQAND